MGRNFGNRITGRTWPAVAAIVAGAVLATLVPSSPLSRPSEAAGRSPANRAPHVRITAGAPAAPAAPGPERRTAAARPAPAAATATRPAPAAATAARPAPPAWADLRAALEDALARGDKDAADLAVADLAHAALASEEDRRALVALLRDAAASLALRRGAAVALGRLPLEDALAALIATLEEANGPPKLRVVAALALGTNRTGAGDEAPPQVNTVTLEGFRISMGPVGEPEVERALAGALADPAAGFDLAISAANALWETRGHGAVDEAFAIAAAGEGSPALRARAIDYLGSEDAAPEALDTILRVLATERDSLVRAHATNALGGHASAHAAAAAARAAADPSEPDLARANACRSLGRIACRAPGAAAEAIAALSRALAGPAGAAKAAREALERLEQESSVPEEARASARAALRGAGFGSG